MDTTMMHEAIYILIKFPLILFSFIRFTFLNQLQFILIKKKDQCATREALVLISQSISFTNLDVHG